jgi:hypothetical protein
MVHVFPRQSTLEYTVTDIAVLAVCILAWIDLQASNIMSADSITWLAEEGRSENWPNHAVCFDLCDCT